MTETANIISSSNRTPPRQDGLATIIVACCGQLEYTRFCAPSLLRFSRQPVEIVFLDCDSLDGTSEYLEGFAAASPVRVEVTRVPAEPPVGPGRKEDLISLRGDFVVLLNNDIIVTQSWLDRLIAMVCTSPDIGMTAPMSNHATSALLVDPVPYGIEMAREEVLMGQRASPWPHIDKVNRFAREWQDQHQGQCFEADSLAGGCVLLKREVLHKLGVFPSRTPLGTFDMEALSSRVRAAGYRLAGCREVFIHHFGSRGR